MQFFNSFFLFFSQNWILMMTEILKTHRIHIQLVLSQIPQKVWKHAWTRTARVKHNELYLIKLFMFWVCREKVLVKAFNIFLEVESFNCPVQNVEPFWIFLKCEHFSIKILIMNVLSQLNRFISWSWTGIKYLEISHLGILNSMEKQERRNSATKTLDDCKFGFQ